MRPHGASPAEALGKRLHRWGGEGWPEDLLVPPKPNLNRWGERVKQLVEAQPYYAQGESRNTEQEQEQEAAHTAVQAAPHGGASASGGR